MDAVAQFFCFVSYVACWCLASGVLRHHMIFARDTYFSIFVWLKASFFAKAVSGLVTTWPTGHVYMRLHSFDAQLLHQVNQS